MLAILSIACIDPTALSGGRKQRKKKKTTKTKGKVIAEKLDEDLWEQAQNDVCKKSEKLCDPSARKMQHATRRYKDCLLYTSPSPRDRQKSRMPSSA